MRELVGAVIMTLTQKFSCSFLVMLSVGLNVAIAQGTDQVKVYDYLSCPIGQITEQKIIDPQKKWVTVYDDDEQKIRLKQLLYEGTNYSAAYVLAKEILAKHPDDLSTLVHVGVNGYQLKGAPLATQALDYAKRALQQLESGRNLDDWRPLPSRDVALAYLNFTVGATTIQNEPRTSLDYLIKSAQFETPLKKSPCTFGYIAEAHETGDYEELSKVYNRDFAGKPETPESKLALANINQTIDRMIDAYSRAVALAGDDPKFAAAKANWNESLKGWYKFRNGGETGLIQLIADVLSKPLPPRPTRLTSFPQ